MMTWFLNLSPWVQFASAVGFCFGVFSLFVSGFVWAVMSINRPRVEEDPWIEW